MNKRKTISEATAEQIDAEIRKIIDDGYNRAKEIIEKNKDELEKLALGLIEYETLSGDEIKDLLAGNKIDRPEWSELSPVKSSIPVIDEDV